MSQETEINSTSTKYKHWSWQQDDNKIVWLNINKADASTNVLSESVLEELEGVLSEVSAASPKGLVIASTKENGFIAGADVKEFTQLKDEASATALIKRGQRVFDKLAALPFPTVALIHG